MRRITFYFSCALVGVALFCAHPAPAGLFSKKKAPMPPLPPPVTNAPPVVATPPPVTNTPPPAPDVKPVIAWDAQQKDLTPKAGDPTANVFFTFTNVSTVPVVVNVVHPSCGCTTAKLPPLPWTVGPGQEGRMDFSVNIQGKSGTLFKTVTVDSTAGNTALQLKVIIPDPSVMRDSNRQMAVADRQAVFKTDCASCHVTPAVGKTGAELFKAACSICHDSPNRATMVPDLHNLPHPTDRDFWKVWITYGKPGSLMPGFAKSQDAGYLTDEQIDSLADYLVSAIPSKPVDATANTPPAH